MALSLQNPNPYYLTSIYKEQNLVKHLFKKLKRNDQSMMYLVNSIIWLGYVA